MACGAWGRAAVPQTRAPGSRAPPHGDGGGGCSASRPVAALSPPGAAGAALPRAFRPPPPEAEVGRPRASGRGRGRRCRLGLSPPHARPSPPGHGCPRQLREQQRVGLLRQAYQRLLPCGHRRLRELLQVREPRGPGPARLPPPPPRPAPRQYPNGAFSLQRLRGGALRDHPGGARLHRRLPHHRQNVCG